MTFWVFEENKVSVFVMVCWGVRYHLDLRFVLVT